MSTMLWTFKGTKDAFTPNGNRITVSEYEFYMDSRGNPQGSRTTQYYEGVVPQKEGTMGRYAPPQAKRLTLGKDFTFNLPDDFGSTETVSESPKKDIGNNTTVMYLGFIVAGYFIYKYMLKP